MRNSCSLGEKEDWADALHDAPEIAVRAGTARVAVKVDLRGIETVGRTEPDRFFEVMHGVVDFAKRRSSTTETTGKRSTLIFDDLVAFLPRSESGSGGEPWVSTDFIDVPEEDIDVEDRRFSLGVPMLSPALSVELLEGVLTGSVERVGTETVGEDRLAHYRAKVAPDNAVREVDDEDRREGILRIFESMGVNAEVVPVEVWLDDRGRVRIVRYELEQRQDRVNTYRTTIRTEISGFGSPAKITVPTEALKTDDFQLFVTEFIRESVDFGSPAPAP
ncbi:MAG: hypothetical protein WD646_09200 [Actinomycetota bacterium]